VVDASGGEIRDSATFDAVPAPETAAKAPAFEGTNVCRAAALSLMLGGDGDGDGVTELASQMGELGFSERLLRGELPWGEIEPDENADPLLGLESLDSSTDEDRVRNWQRLNEQAEQRDALSFLIGVLGSELERESTAAAGALWRHLRPPDHPRPWQVLRLLSLRELLYDASVWSLSTARWYELWTRRGTLDLDVTPDEVEMLPWDPDAWNSLWRRGTSLSVGDSYDRFLLVRLMAELRLDLAVRSPDFVTRSLAVAAYSLSSPADAADQSPPLTSSPIRGDTLDVSTMIHGTWAWIGNWWRPRGAFHDFVLRRHRPNLYARGTRFSWSGRYRKKDRVQAGIDFQEWAADAAPGGLQTVFAHSYGGEVAARALLRGTKLGELVLLSTPATNHVKAAAQSTVRVVDVRLRFDPVLALARTRQRLPATPNVTAVLLDRWTLDHAATHDPRVWQAENIAHHGGI
jgi:hypothetical protein